MNSEICRWSDRILLRTLKVYFLSSGELVPVLQRGCFWSPSDGECMKHPPCVCACACIRVYESVCVRRVVCVCGCSQMEAVFSDGAAGAETGQRAPQRCRGGGLSLPPPQLGPRADGGGRDKHGLALQCQKVPATRNHGDVVQKGPKVQNLRTCQRHTNKR